MAASGSLKFGLVISAVDKASTALKAVTKAFAATSKAGESLKKVGEAMRVARENVDDFTGRVRAGLTSILEPSIEVEAALARLTNTVSVSTNVTAGVLDAARASALAWQSAHTQSAAEYIDTTNAVIAAGIGEANALKATEAALRVAKATSSEASAVARTLGAVYAQVGDQTKDAGSELARLGDVLTRVKQIFPTIDVAALSDPLKDALPAAKVAKVDFTQLVTVLGQFNALGIQGGEAGAGLAELMKSLSGASQTLGFELVKTADGGTDLVATLAGIEKRFGPISKMTPEMAAKFEAAFGPGAFRGLALMVGQTDQLSAALAKVNTSAGAAAAAQATLEGTTAAQMQIAQQQVDAVKIEISQGLTPAILAVIPHVMSVVTAFGRFATEHPQIVATVGTIATLAVVAGTVVGPVLSTVGAISSVAGAALQAAAAVGTWAATTLSAMLPAMGAAIASAWAWTAAMLANPITWIVLAIVALAAVIYIYWEPISAFFVRLWDQIKAAFVGAWNALVAAWDGLVAWFSNLFGGIRDAFKESFVGGLLKLWSTFSPIAIFGKAFWALLPYLATLWQRIVDGFWAGLGELANLGARLNQWFMGGITAAFKAVVGFVSNAWGEIKAAFDRGFFDGIAKLFETFSLVAYIYKAWSAVTQYLFGLSLYETGKAVLTSLLSGIMSVEATIRGWFTSLGQAIIAAIASVGEVIFSGVSNDLDRVMAFLTSFSLADAGRNIVGTIVEGIKSMANMPVEAMTNIVQKVRNLLPFSPAKAGPLRDLHKVKLVETVAEAVRPAPLVDAMTGAAGLAMAAIETAPIPSYVSASSGQGRASYGTGASSASAPPQVTVQIYVGNGTSSSVIDELEAWIRNPSNAARLADAAKRAQERTARTEFK